ncbi:Fizzy protein [Fasciola gigantica]|uniref:Fizzy protein n=1 Tax=Fasciola gigantica TaxID=46835 RepID=A0A504YRL9_FASGI|nr:Fizzy protein [Fasciola gigantica]
MEQGYERRLLGSPYKSPVKPVSPMKTPTKENYVDRYIPVRTNARWKSSSFEPGSSHTRRLFQPNQGTQSDGLFSDLDPNTQPGQQNTSGGFDRNWSRITTAFVGSSSARISRDMPANEPQSIDLLSALVANELAESSSGSAFGANKPDGSNGVLSPRENSNFFSFKMRKDSPCKPKTSPYSMSPVSEKSQRLLKFPQKQTRRISRVPYKVLDAPELQDDFYLNLVDWSSQNVLAVGLGTCVYLWNAFTSQVTRLCDVAGESDVISSVAWSKKGSHLAIGTYRGHVQIWDVTKSSCISSLTGHLARVGALAWNADLLASGSRDRYILLRDTRASSTTGGGPSEPVRNPSLSSTVPTATTSANQGTTNPDGVDDQAEMDDGEQPVGDQRGTELMDTSSDDLLSSAQEHSSTLADTARPSPVESHTPHRAESGLPGGGDLDSVLPWSLPSSLMRASSVITSTASTQVNETVSDRNVRGAVRVLKDHRQEVCGLKWSPDSQYLASGGNDNRLLVWSQHAPADGGPVLTYEEHVAAVKAIAWSPHQHGLLASGGGTADRCIRFWNTLTGQALRSVDTGSQVCNIAWSIHSNELVSTHGYSQNQILVWRYPSLTQLVKLTGHSYRVMYLAISPDGENIVTGAGDETLRFWNIFTRAKTPKLPPSSLNLFNGIR